jgi:hypothetical protein
MGILGGRRSRKKRMHEFQLHEVDLHGTILRHAARPWLVATIPESCRKPKSGKERRGSYRPGGGVGAGAADGGWMASKSRR